MSKIPDCDRCSFYAHSLDFVCAVHPYGVDNDSCLDFRLSPNSEPEELWTPDGVDFIDGELVIRRDQFRYDCSDTLDNYLTPVEKLELLDAHPFFTGRCPNCEMPFDMSNPRLVHWDCDCCNWIDDSV